MLISTLELKSLYPEYEAFNDVLLKRKLEAIETAIRVYTNNNFQNRGIRDSYYSKDKMLVGASVEINFKVGDTVQITQEPRNDGLYVIEDIQGNALTVDREMFDSPNNLVTKVQYPLDVVEGAINILKWDMFDREKVGIASETISRHSVSYQTYDSTNTINGYPSMLFGFCMPYMRART